MSNKYELTESGVLDLETGASIPSDMGNRHYREFLESGETPRPIKPNEYCTWDGTQWVEDTTAKEAAEALAALAASDVGMARLLEDLIATLEAKGIMNKAELPQAAQDKLAERETLRGKL